MSRNGAQRNAEDNIGEAIPAGNADNADNFDNWKSDAAGYRA